MEYVVFVNTLKVLSGIRIRHLPPDLLQKHGSFKCLEINIKAVQRNLSPKIQKKKKASKMKDVIIKKLFLKVSTNDY